MKERKTSIIIKSVIWLVKSLIIGISMLFIFNIVFSSFSINVPINIWTIMLVSLLKLPGLVLIIIFMMIMPFN